MPPLQFEELSASRIEALSPIQTVFFFPVGPLEDHGPHLPVGADVFEAHRLCTLTAERLEQDQPGWTAVIMPRMFLGIDSNTTRLAIRVRGHVLRDWLVDACTALWKQGFRNFVCYSGHLGPRQLTAIEEAAKVLKRRTGGGWLGRMLRPGTLQPSLVSASSALVAGTRMSALWPDPLEHGGARDSSVALQIFPQLVDPVQQTLPPYERHRSRLDRLFRRLRGQLAGYWGNPADATAEQGAALMNEQISKVYPDLRAVWAGGNPNRAFRSWFSIIPSNRSFFKAWLLSLVLICLWLAALLSFSLYD